MPNIYIYFHQWLLLDPVDFQEGWNRLAAFNAVFCPTCYKYVCCVMWIWTLVIFGFYFHVIFFSLFSSTPMFMCTCGWRTQCITYLIHRYLYKLNIPFYSKSNPHNTHPFIFISAENCIVLYMCFPVHHRHTEHRALSFCTATGLTVRICIGYDSQHTESLLLLLFRFPSVISAMDRQKKLIERQCEWERMRNTEWVFSLYETLLTLHVM